MPTRRPARVTEDLTDSHIRAAELCAALSLATDLGSGQPLEHALRTAVLAVRLGERCGVSPADLTDVYYVALLHASGCTSDGHEAQHLYGDDIEPRAAFALLDTADVDEIVAFLRGYVGADRPPAERTALVEYALRNGLPLARQALAMHCEVAQRFASWLGLSVGTTAALEHSFERWDGHGFPGVTAGDALPLPARLLHVARDISIFLNNGGVEAARVVLATRAGTAYDPWIAGVALDRLDTLLGDLDETRIWEQAIDAEPKPGIWFAGDEIDAAFGALATFADLKSPWFRTHSLGVAEIAEAAAWRLDLPAPAVARLRRAALVHDLGRVGVSNAIWEKAGPLTFGERERVRLHPHFTERAFAQSQTLAEVGALGGAHHERLDGSGYHRGRRAADLDLGARVLAAADHYCSLREARPYRPAFTSRDAAARLHDEVTARRLDAEAVSAVLAAAGHPRERHARDLPAGLTARELQVLRALVVGMTNEEIAARLRISPKTVGHHVQHIYQKAGVRSRAAATVWAFEHALISPA
ncbi:MAG: HD domain-containing phosphohydrolase [Dehalococcoidia bacterium]